MTTVLGDLSPAGFLSGYWQKKPLLVRGAFPGFDPMVSSDDLAGLACEDFADSRIITGKFPHQAWRLMEGPFEESVYASLPETNWTLLVQDAEKHFPELRAVMAAFGFIPGWRLDDLMISYAAPGGSVGPHVDQYDVFLIQAEGQRRWQIAREFDPEVIPDSPVKVLREFSPEQDWVLDKGDMLYLPPGVAHHGIAVGECVTFSVGFRAPSVSDLANVLGLKARCPDPGNELYSDADLRPALRHGEVDACALDRVRALFGTRDIEDLALAFTSFVSRFGVAREAQPPENLTSLEQARQLVDRRMRFSRDPWVRTAWTVDDGSAALFANGTGFHCSVELAGLICDPAGTTVFPEILDHQDLVCVTELLNYGIISPDEPG